MNCGRKLDVTAPAWIVGDGMQVLCWRQSFGPGFDAQRELAVSHLIGEGRGLLAVQARESVPLTTVQLKAMLLVEPETNIPLARPAIFRTAESSMIERMLEEAELRHLALGPEDCAAELIHVKTYTLAAAIWRIHPVLRNHVAQQELNRTARQFHQKDMPHRADDLRRLARTRGSRPKRVEKATPAPSATVRRHVWAAGQELPASAAEALDEYIQARRQDPALCLPTSDLADQTWWGLATMVDACGRHTLDCACPEVALELLGRAKEGLYDTDVYDMLGELGLWLTDVAGNGPDSLADVTDAIYKALAKVFDGRDRFRYARTRTNTAVLYNRWRSRDVEAKLREGEHAARDAQAFFDRQNHPKEWARAAESLGNNFASRLTGDAVENVRQAVFWLEQALQVRTRESDPFGHVQVQKNLATLLIISGSPTERDKAIAMLEDARAFDSTAGRHDFWRTDTSTLALALFSAGPAHWGRSEELLLELLADTDRQRQPEAWTAIARQAAVAGIWRRWHANGGRHDSRALHGPLDLLWASLETAVVTGSDRAVRASGENLGTFLLETGQPAQAADVLGLAVEAAERIRQAQGDREARIAERRGDESFYLAAALAYLQAARPLQAALVLERLRARELVDERAAATLDPVADDVTMHVTPGRAALYLWGLGGGTTALLFLEGSDGEVMPVAAQTPLLTVPAEGELWGRAVVTATAPMPPAASRLAFDRGALDGQTRLRATGAPFGEAGRTPDLGLLTAPLTELGAALGPALIEAGVTEVALVACGPLGNVPWMLMPLGDGRQLGEVVDLALAPSLTWLRNQRETSSSGTTTVVVADTDNRPGKSLPYADAEANDLTQLPSTVRLTGSDATRDGLLARLAVARCLHLACHGEVSGPKVSARHFYPPITMSDRLVDAVLSDERRVAGIEPPTVSIRLANGSLLDPAALRARRIATSIVVLAACDTAVIARQEASDELWGLPGGFLAAGASAVVAALWPVDDRSAALLMVRLHNMLADGMAVGPALRLTQQWLRAADVEELTRLLEGLPHLASLPWPWRGHLSTDRPYADEEHWAGYVIIGNPRQALSRPNTARTTQVPRV